MDQLLNESKKYDLIGIGENSHGELTSWKYRYQIVKYLTKYFDNVIIFCETFDPYISDLNNKNTKFDFYNENNFPIEFYPSMMFQANKTSQHLKITKKFNKLVPKVEFYGIDIQIVKFHDMYINLNINIKKVIDKYKKIYLTTPTGAIRNKCNALIINDLILQTKNKNNIYLYFAHNEHISFNCNEMRKNNKYKTEGFYLYENPLIKYLSIATFSPIQYSLWDCSEICKIKKFITKSKKWNNIFINNNNTVIITNNYKIPMLGNYYTDDFNYTIADNLTIIPILL
jgi:hypothetical protein